MFRHFAGLGRVHFVGIGGAGMSGIAEILLSYDLAVTGSDAADSATTRRLAEKGARVMAGHDRSNVEGADLVVVSSAIPADNPELAAALEAGITVVRRAEMLAELMRLKYGIAVAGTHGKTTTTSLIGTLLTESGLDPTVIVGGRLRVTGTGARLGHSIYMVAEADEYDRSFLHLSPIIGVITNIDRDHLDTYRDLEAITDAFVTFARKIPFFGQVIVCLDDPNVQRMLPRIADRRITTYGLVPQADLQATRVEADHRGTSFTVRRAGSGSLGRVDLPLPGRHNVQNALAAVAVGLALGLDFETIAEGLATFSGVHRRFERLGSFHDAAVVDDYAHHPTEVAATLEAARRVFPDGRILAVFQPHLYSRTELLADDFGRALLRADLAWITDVYGSREEPRPGVSGELVVAAARAAGHRHVTFAPDRQALPALLAEHARAGDVILTLGAGDIVHLAEALAGDEG